MGMLFEEVAEEVHADAFAHLAEHPTDRLVHEVVGMMQMHLGIAETPRRVALLRSLPCANHADALFPETRALYKRVKHFHFVVVMKSCRFATHASGSSSQ